MIQIEHPVILSTAYFPNIQYISKLLAHKEAIIDIHETYLKQSYRNRCAIYGANGKQELSIPIIKPFGNKSKTKDILIEYDTNWMQVHWRAIVSAYNRSPFFEFFEHELHVLFTEKVKYLVDFNFKALRIIGHSLDHSFNLSFSESYLTAEPGNDFRTTIHPKRRLQKPDPTFNPGCYYQVFQPKLGFIENLSFIDLMFNEGPQAISVCLHSISNFS